MKNSLNKFKERVDQAIASFLTVYLIIMVLLALWQVFSRYLSPYFPFVKPSVFTDELLRIMLIQMGMIGAAYGFGRRSHLAFSFIVNKLPPLARMILTLITDGIILFFAVRIMFFGGIEAFRADLDTITPILKLSQGRLYLVVTVAGGLIALLQSIVTIGDLCEFTEKKTGAAGEVPNG